MTNDANRAARIAAYETAIWRALANEVYSEADAWELLRAVINVQQSIVRMADENEARDGS